MCNPADGLQEAVGLPQGRLPDCLLFHNFVRSSLTA